MAAMTVPLVTVGEYLHSSYDPDVDYVDGALEDRNGSRMDSTCHLPRLRKA